MASGGLAGRLLKPRKISKISDSTRLLVYLYLYDPYASMLASTCTRYRDFVHVKAVEHRRCPGPHVTTLRRDKIR